MTTTTLLVVVCIINVIRCLIEMGRRLENHENIHIVFSALCGWGTATFLALSILKGE